MQLSSLSKQSESKAQTTLLQIEYTKKASEYSET